MSENVIEIRVRVKDDAAAQVAKIAGDLKAATAAAGMDVGLGADGRKSRIAKPDPVKVPVELDGDPFEREFRAAMSEAEKASEDAGQSITKSFGDVAKASRDVRAAAGELGPAARDAGSGLDDAGRKADSAGKNANSGAGNFAFLHSRLVLVGGAALALGPALAAGAAVMGAGAAAAGVMGLAFGGVIKALRDYGAQSTSSGQSGAQLAATAFSNSLAIRGAETAITDAKRQAAIAQQNSADTVAAAEQRLGSAQQTLTMSQEALTLAERDGVNVLKDLSLAAQDSANSVVDAELAVQQAQENATKAKNNSLLTDLQKKQAAQGLVDAQQHLQDAQQRNTEAQQAANDANAKGVEGSTAVVAARRSEASAALGVTDAQHALLVAQRNAAEQQRASTEQIAKAVQNLSDTYRQQQLAAAAAAASGSAGVNQFAKDMAGLSPVGRAAVLQILALKGGMHDLSLTAQNATLPGFMAMLKGAAGMGPQVTAAVQGIGSVIGGVFAQMGGLLQSPVFRGQLSQVFKDGLGFAQQFGSAVVPMISGLTAAFANAGPIVAGIGSGFHDIMASGIPAFFQGLTVNASGSGQAFKGFLDLISGLLGPLGTLAGAFSGALGPALADLAPIVHELATKLVTSLMPVWGPLGKALDSVVKIAGSLLKAFEPMIPLIANALVSALKILNPILDGLAKFLESNAGWLKFAGTALFYLLNPIAAVSAALGWMGLTFKGLRDFIGHAWADIKGWFFDGLHAIEDVWHSVEKGADLAWKLIKSNIITPVSEAFIWVSNKVGEVVGWFAALPGRLEKAGAGMWDWLWKGFKGALNLIIGWWDSLNFTVPGFHIPGTDVDVGGFGIGMPHIDKLATGGIGSGLARIGEQGGEMVRLPSGSVVMPHSNTQSAMAAGGGGVSTVQLQWVGPGADGDFMRWLRGNIRATHGSGPDSVQLALGQRF